MYRTVVTVCAAQWSLYVPHSGHNVPHNGHYMYRTVVTICTAQWSLYVPHSGHYMYLQWSLYVPTVVTTCTAQWSPYVPHSGHYMYHQFNIQQPHVLPHTAVFMCFVWISEQTAIISLYSINWLVFVTETDSVYCAVRTVYLNSASQSKLALWLLTTCQ